MWGHESKRVDRIGVLIGKRAWIQGDVDFEGGLHLDGRVTGRVRAGGAAGSLLSVSESGCIEGAVEVANVILNGTIKGDIHASERVVLGPSSKVEGDVHYGTIETAAGAEIVGRMVPVEERPAPGAAPGEADTFADGTAGLESLPVRSATLPEAAGSERDAPL